MIGDPGDNGGAGAAWVFTRSEGGAWTQQGGKLTGGEEEGEGRFGTSVALSGEGNAALIGGPGDGGKVGAAWVFAPSGEVWSQEGAKLTGTGGSGAGEFGWSVALSREGTTALIGAPGDGSNAGAAWAFAASSEGAWSQQGEKLTGSGEGGAGALGRSVALSSDGSTALLGGPADSANTGAAWVFTRSQAAAWSQQGGKLTGGEEEGEGQFGSKRCAVLRRRHRAGRRPCRQHQHRGRVGVYALAGGCLEPAGRKAHGRRRGRRRPVRLERCAVLRRRHRADRRPRRQHQHRGGVGIRESSDRHQRNPRQGPRSRWDLGDHHRHQLQRSRSGRVSARPARRASKSSRRPR